MQKIIRFIPIAIFCLIGLFSCNSKTDNSKYISKDAMGVVAINTVELSKKIAWNVLSGSPIFGELMQSGSDTAQFDIEKTGMQPLGTYYFYASPDQRLSGQSRIMMIVPLTDAAKFSTFLKEKFPEAKTQPGDKISLATIGEYAAVAWDKQTAIVAVGTQDEWNGNTSTPVLNILTEEVQKAFNMPADQSINSLDKFGKLLKEGNDLSFWVNYETMISNMPQETIGTAGAVLASQKKLLKDAYVAAGLNFEKGKINADAIYYYNDAVKAVAEALDLKKADQELLARLPGQQLNLLMSYHFNPEGLRVLMDTMGVLPIATLWLREAGVDINDLLAAFTGDFLLSIADFDIKTESRSYSMGGESVNYTSPVPSFKAVLSFKINDEAAFNRLLQLGISQQLIKGSAEGLYSIGNTAALAVKGSYGAFSNEAATAASVANGSMSGKVNIPSEVKKSPYAFYADVQHSIQSIPLDLLYGKEDTAVFHHGKNLIEHVVAYVSSTKGNQSNFHAEVTFQNKNENSLMQIIQFSQKVAEAEKRNGNSIEEVIPEEDTIDDPATNNPI
jgi:hypothetical protein